MKARKKWALLAVIILLVNMITVMPISAAKPDKSDCGLLCITTSGDDLQQYLAVCVKEEDGKFVYSGSHPIQQQIGIYSSVTNSLNYNSYYNVEEDIGYEGPEGIYRFALGEKLESGAEADVFPEMTAVQKKDTVYFVHLDLNDSDAFVMEKTTVKSIKNGVMTTEDELEKDSESGGFYVIFDDNGNVAGFCKSGVANAPLSGNSGAFDMIWLISFGVGAVVVGLLIWIKRKNRKSPAPMENYSSTQLADDSTILDSDTQMENISEEAFALDFALRCHGGYLNGRSYHIPLQGITIGRDPDNSIRYPAQTPGISRHHVKIFWQNGRLVLMDAGSSNGTYLNQSGRVPSMHPVELELGDVFYLGEKLNGFEVVQADNR